MTTAFTLCQRFAFLHPPSLHVSHATVACTIMAAATRRSSRLQSQDAAKASPDAAAPPPQQPAPRSRKRRQSPQTAPATPTKKRAQPNGHVPPSTPTSKIPSFASEESLLGKKPRNAAVARLADPLASNATLLSPESSRIIASKDAEPSSPSKPPNVRITTANLLQEAREHLIRVDERMRPLVEKHHCRVFSPEGLAEKVDPFESLSSGIISQQVSGAAAKSIKARFVALFDGDGRAPGRFPHPSEVAACSLDRLRSAGLSQRKAEYIQGLAEKFTSGELSAQMLHDAPYEEVLEKLIAVRGLGKWSVEMFACFGLKRMDVFSLGDLGVQRGMAAFVGRDIAKLKAKGGKWKYMSEQDMLELSEKFAPYRSLFMWYMWRVEETDISTLE